MIEEPLHWRVQKIQEEREMKYVFSTKTNLSLLKPSILSHIHEDITTKNIKISWEFSAWKLRGKAQFPMISDVSKGN